MSRHRILGQVRAALLDREKVAHPGPFLGERPAAPPSFEEAFTGAGGQVVRVASRVEAAAWIASFASGFGSVCCGPAVPTELRPSVPKSEPRDAELGVSRALGAVAETGTLILSAEDGRAVQLLPPTHVVVVDGDAVFATLRDAILALEPAFGSAAGLHSGPSKSADIGQMLVQGVHGPGRLVALVVGDAGSGDG